MSDMRNDVKEELEQPVNCLGCTNGNNCNFISTKQGYCCYSLEPGKNAIIFNLYIYPEFRRLGYAKQLLKLCILVIRSKGYENAIEVEVSPKENSISKKDLIEFYQKLGLLILL